MEETLKNATMAVHELALFDWTDYSVFFMMLLSSALIGVYFGCFGSKQNTPAEYLLGGKSMKALPIGLSLVARYVMSTLNVIL